MASQLMFFALFLVCVLQTGNSLRCYSCSSPIFRGCGDPFANSSEIVPVPCNERDNGCMKQILPAEGNNQRIIDRGCTSVAYCERPNMKAEHCSICTQDLCNSSPILIPSIVLITVIFIKSFLC